MAKKMVEQSFLKRLFGKKSKCCSFQIEEIRNDTTGGVTRDQKHRTISAVRSLAWTKITLPRAIDYI